MSIQHTDVTALYQTWFVQENKDALPLLIDIRTEEEFEATGVIEASLLSPYPNNPLMNPDWAAMVQGELDRSQPVYLMCRSGVRSMSAANDLLALGFEHIINVQGGINAWLAQDYPVVAYEEE